MAPRLFGVTFRVGETLATRDKIAAHELVDEIVADNPDCLTIATKAIALGLGCRWAGVGRLTDDGMIDVFAVWDQLGDAAPFRTPLAGAPCESVYKRNLSQPYLFVPCDLVQHHQIPESLKKAGAQSYRGEAIFDGSGEAIAHIFAVDTSDMEENSDDRLFFRMISQRVGSILNQWQLESALKSSEARFRAVTDHLAEGLFIHDMNGTILDVNQRVCEKLGFARDELVGQRVDKVEIGVPAQAICETWKSAPFDEVLFFKGVHKHKDGSTFPVDVRGRRMVLEGRDCAVVSARDMTDTIRAEQALMAAKMEAETASRAKSDFIANVSHELRTPLNAIIGFSQTMTESVFGPIGNPRYEQYTQDILRSGYHLLDLISDVLDLSKIEAGELGLSESRFPLEDIIKPAVTLVSGSAASRAVKIQYSDPENPVFLLADKVRMKQVLINLLANAVKYSPAGETVLVDVQVVDDGQLSIIVSDRGPGMEQQKIEMAFEAFRRLDPNTRSEVEGTGLGLPIARKLSELHGGSLRLESELDVGTQAIVTLPSSRVELEVDSGRGDSARRAASV